MTAPRGWPARTCPVCGTRAAARDRGALSRWWLDHLTEHDAARQGGAA